MPPDAPPVPHVTQTLELVPIAALRPHPRNDGTHPPVAQAPLRASIRAHGIYRNVVIAQDGTLLAGHGVACAAQAEGRTQIAVQRMPYGPDDPRAIQLLLGDNHIARLRQQGDAALLALLEDLAHDDPTALLGTGYDAALLEALAQQQALLGGGGSRDAGRDVEPQIDRAEELRQEWGVDEGQVWVCGEHRVICGDCTEKRVMAAVLGHTHPDAIVTDPPYGRGVASRGFEETLENVRTLITRLFALVETIEPIALTPGIPALWAYPPPRWLLAWVHPAPTSSGPWGFNGLNPLLVYGEDPYLTQGLGRRLDHSVAVADRAGMEGHPTPKPLKVWTWLIERVTIDPGAVVYDPFLGSGTSLIACDNLHRICYGCELDPGYVAVTLQRYSDLTGDRPTLLEPSPWLARRASPQRSSRPLLQPLLA